MFFIVLLKRKQRDENTRIKDQKKRQKREKKLKKERKKIRRKEEKQTGKWKIKKFTFISFSKLLDVLHSAVNYKKIKRS